jgi:glycosyltransferase involved in cell wall biosynthesis
MSSLYEGFALSVLEAMAMGMPALLTDIASFKEQCDDTASYYKLNSKNDFILQLLSLKNNRQQLTFLGRNCRKRALENYTLQKHMAGLKAIYYKALAEAQPDFKLSLAK